MKDITTYILEHNSKLDKIINLLTEYDYVEVKHDYDLKSVDNKYFYILNDSCILFNFSNRYNYGEIKLYKTKLYEKLKLTIISYKNYDEYIEIDKPYNNDTLDDVDKFLSVSLADYANMERCFINYEKINHI